MISKKANRLRRAKRTRAKISELGAHRLNDSPYSSSHLRAGYYAGR